jgi:hypothetical protein
MVEIPDRTFTVVKEMRELCNDWHARSRDPNVDKERMRTEALLLLGMSLATFRQIIDDAVEQRDAG